MTDLPEILRVSRSTEGGWQEYVRADIFGKVRMSLEDTVYALEVSKEDIEHWGGYAGEYFQAKHGLEDDISRVTKQIDSANKILSDSV